MEKDKEIWMTRSPIERHIDMYGCEIGISRQWYEETCLILEDINNGVYYRKPEDSIMFTKEELMKHDKKVESESFEKFLYAFGEKCPSCGKDGIKCVCNRKIVEDKLRERFGIWDDE